MCRAQSKQFVLRDIRGPARLLHLAKAVTMVLEMSFCLLLLFACLPVMAGEKAAYDSHGQIISMISDAGEVEIASSIVAVLPTGKPVPLQMRREDSGAVRQRRNLAWSAAFSLPDGGRGRLECKSEEGAAGLSYSTTVSADSPLELNGIEFRLDLPRPAFVDGTAAAEGGAPPVALAGVRAAGPVLFRGQTPALHFQDAKRNLAFDIGFNQPTVATTVDRWDNAGRSFQVRTAILSGGLPAGHSATFAAARRHPYPSPA